jgi:hypothetical protein
MKAEITIQISEPHEIAKLLSLIEDGFKILNHQDRNQRGIDGYTKSSLKDWHSKLSGATQVRCEYADSDIFS